MPTDKIILPTEKTRDNNQIPKNLVIFSKPKTGKTSILAQLPNCLILDLEKGSTFVEAMRLSASTAEEIQAIGKAVADAGFPYDYVAIDTVTALEDIACDYAEKLYSESPMGKYWFNPKDSVSQSGKQRYGGILGLPEGAGYYWLRLAFERLISFISKLAPRIILSCHVKDIYLTKDEIDFTAADIYLTGRLKQMVSAKSDSIGYLYRKKNQCLLSFKSSDTVLCGARPSHLEGNEIVISEKIGGVVQTYWDKIYLDIIKN